MLITRSRTWLSGRASPCQGEGRGFESRRPLQRKGPTNFGPTNFRWVPILHPLLRHNSVERRTRMSGLPAPPPTCGFFDVRDAFLSACWCGGHSSRHTLAVRSVQIPIKQEPCQLRLQHVTEKLEIASLHNRIDGQATLSPYNQVRRHRTPSPSTTE